MIDRRNDEEGPDVRSHARFRLALAALVFSCAAGAGIRGEQSAVVSGRVVEGLQDTIVSDAAVRLRRRDAVQAAANVRTDANGMFAFPAVPDGVYDLSASKAGFIPGNLGQRRDVDRGHVLVVSGKAIPNLRIPLWKEATISGRLTDGSGQPLRGVTVRAFGEVLSGGRLSWMPQGESPSDNRGSFRISNLVTGRYLVAAGRGFPEKTPPTFFPSTSDPLGALPIELVSGEDRLAVDILVPTVTSFAVSGRVETDGDTSRTSVRLTIPSGDTRSYFVAGFAPVSADGTFHFSEVAPGNYVLEVYSALGSSASWIGGETDPRTYTAPALDATTIARGPRVVTGIAVRDRNVVMGAIALPAARSIRGTVSTEPGISGTLERLPSGLSAISADGRSSASAVQDSSGNFIVSDLNPGSYFLRYTGVLPTGWVLSDVLAANQSALNSPLVLIDRNVDDARVYLTNKVSEVTGTVRDQATSALDSDSSVLAFPTDRRTWLDNGRNDPRIRSARAQADGNFLFVGLPPGEYFLVGLKEEHARNWQTAANLALLATISTKLKIGAGQKVSLNVTSVSRLPGR